MAGIDLRLTAEDVLKLQEYIDGTNDAVIAEDVVDRFFRMGEALRRKMLSDARQYRSRSERLGNTVERIRSKEKDDAAAGKFNDLGFTSVEIARALTWCLTETGVYTSAYKKQYILYEIYASWLNSHRERICIEHPEAVEWGPWFWSVSKNMEKGPACTKDDWDAVHARNAGLAVMIRNAARKYAATSERDIKDYLVRSKPYRMSTKEHNGGKWNKEIPDKEIYLWKEYQRGKQ